MGGAVLGQSADTAAEAQNQLVGLIDLLALAAVTATKAGLAGKRMLNRAIEETQHSPTYSAQDHKTEQSVLDVLLTAGRAVEHHHYGGVRARKAQTALATLIPTSTASLLREHCSKEAVDRGGGLAINLRMTDHAS